MTRPSRSGCTRASLIALVVVVALLVLAPAASASSGFCLLGSAAGQCENPEGVAVDEASGDVFVVDRSNNRVNVFDSAGNFRLAWGYGVADGTTAALQRCGPAASPPTASCFQGIAGSGPGQFHEPRSISIDEDPASPSYRDVYVGTDNFRVQKFDREGHFLLTFGTHGNGSGEFNETADPIAVGPGGTVYVGDSHHVTGEIFEPRLERFDATGSFLGSCEVTDSTRPLHTLAVDSSGHAYAIFDEAGGGVHKYETTEPACTVLADFDASTQTRLGLAVDVSDHVFVVQEKDTGGRFITEYDAAGTKLSRFGYGETKAVPHGLAVKSLTGDLYYSEEENKVVHLTPPPPGPLIAAVKTLAAGNIKVTLEGLINPEGKETTYHIDYVDQKGFEEEGGFLGPTVKSTLESASIGADFELHPASAQVGCPNPLIEAGEAGSKCLTPETLYRFRLVAKNADGESEAEGSFETLPPVEIDAAWSSEVGVDAARLHGEVNPLGIPATGYFEYVDEATYLKDVEASGPGHGFDHGTEAPEVGEGQSPLDFGAGNAPLDRSVQLYPLAPHTTYRYRLVAADPFVTVFGEEHTFTTFAPPSQANTSCPNQAFRSGASALLPDCRAYELVTPLDKNSGDVVVLGNINSDPAGLDQGSVAGGKLTYSAYRAFGDAQSGPFTSQYLAARGPEGWSSEGISPPRGFPFLGVGYSLDTEFRAFSPDLCSDWLVHDTDPPLASGAVEGFANLYRRQGCGGESYEALTTAAPQTVTEGKNYHLELQGLSADGATAIFRVNDKLTGNAIAGKNLLYESRGGAVRLVCVLPNNTASKEGCSAGTGQDVNTGRYKTVSHAISADGSRIFWTASEEGQGSIYVRIGHKKTVAVGAGQFWTAAADGSVAVFTNGDFEKSKATLHEFDVDTEGTRLIAGEVAGVVGASEDASRIYFASKETLAAGATAGKPNLYLYEAGEASGTFSFIATLAGKDIAGFNRGPLDPRPIKHTIRVGADGELVAFTSRASIGGYDNTDVKSGEPDAEVYLYDANANEGAGKLVCASCNPSGARPAGKEAEKGGNGEAGLWAAAEIPASESQLYATRALSDDGARLLFESFDALVARDNNGTMDVYEWEAPGKGDCTTESPAFSPPNGGCLSLISSGESAQDTEFVDASPSGEDVFLRTNASLLPQDYGLVDIYDARTNGGYPAPPAPPAACEGDACQGPLSPPSDPTPASSAFEGAGNVRKGGAGACRKGKVRRKGRCVVKVRHERNKERSTNIEPRSIIGKAR